MRELDCDVAVIGAGTAGLAAHRAARAAGARAVLIERGPGGTTCARVGCMPSKLLVAAGDAAHGARSLGLFGLSAGVAVDGRAVLARLRAERDRFVASALEGVEALPEGESLSGQARFVDPGALRVGEDVQVRFRAAVVAAGSSPSVPGPLRALGERVLTTDGVFEIADLPESLAVVGAGPLGLEIAQAMARLGVRVSLLDAGTALGGLSEPGLVEAARAIFGAELDLHLGAELESARIEEGAVRLAWRGRDGGRASRFAAVLAAAGRRPNLDGLDLSAAGLRPGEDGMPAFDPRSLLCADGPVLIAGDANGARPVLHEARRQGEIAGRNAAALAAGRPPAAPEPWPALAITFTDPGIAVVGAPYDPEEPGRVAAGAEFGDQGRARVEGRNRGALRLWADSAGRLTGGEMLGPAAEHLAHILAYAIQDGSDAEGLRARPTYHPTYEEVLDGVLYSIIQKIGR